VPAPDPARPADGGFRHGGPLEPSPSGASLPPPGPATAVGARRPNPAYTRGREALARGQRAVARITGPVPRIRPPAALSSGSGGRPAAKFKGPLRDQWKKLAPIYDTDGPRIRLGVVWFAVAFPLVGLSTLTTALLYAVCSAFAARQVAQAWKTERWQADAAAAVAALPTLAVAVMGTGITVPILVVTAAAAFGVGVAAPCGRLRSPTGNIAAAGILVAGTVPLAVAGIAMVAMRAEIVASLILLFVLACVYEVGDFLVGSGSSNKFEGPIAGGAAVAVTAFPFALLLIEPFDVLGLGMLGVAAAVCPFGQWLASAILPWPGAHAPALRRMDTLLLLAPLWAVAAGVV
jgi:hypothetical protein